MNRLPRFLLLALSAGSLLMAGCSTFQTAKHDEPAPKPVAEKASPSSKASGEKSAAAEKKTHTPERTSSAPEIALNEGIALYNDGDFNGAIRKLNTVKGAEKPVQLSAYKYSAFSYCVSGRKVACRHQFEKALKLDPNFDLEPGEKGHPLWGPVFARVKNKKK
ncbi:MAG TPA: TssQ family T6SS-associated lipoprotein [Noviherbaspirillum sp.]|uniref:TssQ family T6SS-associated lipoprotein n=1 Tax=Noviherbaspirillum sp. TaxID=1926288 RepID=UPI002B46875E|nr:TssQ family T6SS-associated lipoprotein [Noviherbaspirillum sp.]HJV86280.1 TssQ family T6SS-associated lipoprotein [Noviherbaspirillum sp.]